MNRILRNFFFNYIHLKHITYIIFVAIIFIPDILWDTRGVKFIGGDDTMLYYFYPIEYIKYLFNIISDNTAGALSSYFSQAQFIPTVFGIFVLKKYVFFTQGMILGLNLAIGYLFFYHILNLFYKENKYLNNIVSLLYPFSIFIYFTSYNSFFPSLFLISILPICIYYFLYGVITNKNIKIIISSIIFGLFSSPIINISWILAFFVCSIPILIYYGIKYRKQFLNKSVLFLCIMIGLSLFFIIPTVDSVLNKSEYDLNTINRVLSNDDTINRSYNTNLIKAVSQNNDIIYPLLGLFHKNLQEDFNWYTLNLFKSYYIKILFINTLVMGVIILTLLILNKKNNKIHIYPYLILSLFLSIYFFTANVGVRGLDLFLFLNNNIPGFVMFRNMYDKFALALAFYYVLTFAIGANVLYGTIKNRFYKKLFLLSILMVTFLNIYPFITGKLYQNKIFRSTQSINDRISDFNQDFKDMSIYIQNMDANTGRFLWLPMSESNYIPIWSGQINQYYLGQSPLLVLTGKNDFSSDMGFFITNNKDSIVNKIKEGKFDEVAKFLQKRNVEYIILNKNLSQGIKDSYLYSNIENSDFFNIENSDFFKFIQGEKIKDFGDTYSIYKISNNFQNQKIYLKDRYEESIFNNSLQSKINFSKKSSYEYTISIKDYNGEDIIFLEPYHQYWNLYLKGNNIDENQNIVYEYANQWTIDPEYIKANFDKSYYKENSDGSIDIELTLYFKPQSYFYLGIIISGTTLILCLGYLGYAFYRKRGGKG